MVPSASTSKIPALLQPFLLHHRHSQHNQEDGGAPSSDGQLVLLTSVLGASANWLVLRWLYALLLLLLPPRRDVSLPVGGDAVPVGDDGGGGGGSAGDGHNDGMAVVLCSFLRDGAFWREGAAKMGLDLDSLQKQNRFLFVDGLTGLYCPMDKDTAKSGDVFLQQGSVGATLEKAVAELARSSGRGKVVLVLDQMDAWLAMGEVSCMEALNLVTRLRENVHSLVMTVAADDALLHAQSTTLEREHAAFATTLAHEASCVMSLRLLDTGTADDVSGVLRITDADQGVEYLYHVGDAHVRVFERGT